MKNTIPTERARAVILNAVLETTVSMNDGEILADLVEVGMLSAGFTSDNVLVFTATHPELAAAFGAGLFRIGGQGYE